MFLGLFWGASRALRFSGKISSTKLGLSEMLGITEVSSVPYSMKYDLLILNDGFRKTESIFLLPDPSVPKRSTGSWVGAE